MQSTLRLMLVAVLPLALAACSVASPPPREEPVAPAEHMVGGDRDAHGCIASAGYQWCQRAKRCVRSWELAKEAGFDNTPDAFAQYCAAEGDPPSAPHR
jgi:hypothetical protein